MTTALDPDYARQQRPLSSRRPLHDTIELIRQWRRRAVGRRELACFDARLREDIGVRYEDAWRERRKHFWRP